MKIGFGAAALASMLLVPLLATTVIVPSAAGRSTDPAPLCTTAGGLSGLDATQAANARTIVATAIQLTGQASVDASRVSVIALMTAYQESHLHNLANSSVPESLTVPGADGVGSDHDSVGLFQQRPSWGTVLDRMTPAHATQSFVDRLLALPGWRSLAPGEAAQAVQVSAFPDAYAQWYDLAASWATSVTADGDQCGGAITTGFGSTRIPQGYRLPSGTSAAAATAVTFALAQLGKPYLWGASGPTAFDCSGLTMAAWAAAGVSLPHYTVAQAQMGTRVSSVDDLEAGDLVLTPGSDGSLAAPGHVGMFLGNGLVIEAPQTNDHVKIVSIQDFTPIAALRHIG